MLRPILAILFAGLAAIIAAEPLAIAAVPAGRLQTALLNLPPEARTRALRMLGRHPGLIEDIGHLQVSPHGRLRFDNCRPVSAPPAASAATARTVESASVAVTNPPAYSSLPGSTRVLYLDFNGHLVTGTSWNAEAGVDASLNTVAFSLDADRTTFTDQEQEAIRLIWSRVAEDFRPFDINVTTVEPAVFGPLTGRALITRSTDADSKNCPSSDAGGVAYVGTFGDADYQDASPAWIYQDNLSNDESIIADVISHEFGHNLGLRHDGKTGQAYYPGHGDFSFSWGPIMGAPYGRTITQWSLGEYAAANNKEDDLAIIAANLTVITDDHGDLPGTASLASFVAGPGSSRDVASGTGGVITSRNDSDLFRFMAAAGPVSFTVTPFSVTSTPAVDTPGTNLDVQADILDEAGVTVASLSSDPVNDPVASISGTLPQAGVYHLRVRGAGNLDPRTTGFSTYASIGSYTVTGNVPAAVPGTISFSAATLSQNEGSTTRTILLTVQRSFDAIGDTSVDYATADLTAVAGTDYEAASGNLVWLDGDPAEQTVAITVHGDTIIEANHSFTVTLSNPTNSNVLGLAPTITVTLRNDDGSAGSSGGGGGGGGGGGCSAGSALSLVLLTGLGLLRRRRR
jgi:hypothetical protein